VEPTSPGRPGQALEAPNLQLVDQAVGRFRADARHRHQGPDRARLGGYQLVLERHPSGPDQLPDLAAQPLPEARQVQLTLLVQIG
jgi:hypothetical protein